MKTLLATGRLLLGATALAVAFAATLAAFFVGVLWAWGG